MASFGTYTGPSPPSYPSGPDLSSPIVMAARAASGTRAIGARRSPDAVAARSSVAQNLIRALYCACMDYVCDVKASFTCLVKVALLFGQHGYTTGTTDVHPRENCIAPDIAFIVWTTDPKSARAPACASRGFGGSPSFAHPLAKCHHTTRDTRCVCNALPHACNISERFSEVRHHTTASAGSVQARLGSTGYSWLNTIDWKISCVG